MASHSDLIARLRDPNRILSSDSLEAADALESADSLESNLRGKIDEVLDERNALQKRVGELEQQIALRDESAKHWLAERDALERDAERYRWLRNNVGPPTVPHIVDDRGFHSPTLIREAADFAIDAAMRGEGEK